MEPQAGKTLWKIYVARAAAGWSAAVFAGKKALGDPAFSPSCQPCAARLAWTG